jgi:antitoxin (DNA-binding transcriptional repressor) of toxin-antitoxin stability system
MKAITVTDVEANFSDVLFQVKNGEKFKIFYGNYKEAVAMIIPFENKAISRNIGILNGKAKFKMSENDQQPRPRRARPKGRGMLFL